MPATGQGEIDDNLERYSSPEVVEYYARAAGLEPAEDLLFHRYIKPGMSVIDLGVGGGRTAPHLAARATTYVGIDYSPPMIASCRARFPNLHFEVQDVRDLSAFADASFDAAVFSFNGLDYLATATSRARCLTEVSRVLVDGGLFIFSSHNARALGVAPKLRGAGSLRIAWRIAWALGKSIALAARNLRSGVFSPGEGYVVDPVHGGLRTYVSTPTTVARQLAAVGLEISEVISGPFPHMRVPYLIPWYYYACRRLPRP